MHNEEFHNLHCSPNIIKAIRAKVTRYTGHVAQMRKMRNAHIIFLENLVMIVHLISVYGI